jgi:hypothetical protein
MGRVPASQRHLKPRATCLREIFDSLPGELLRTTVNNWYLRRNFPSTESKGIFAADGTITEALSRPPVRRRKAGPAEARRAASAQAQGEDEADREPQGSRSGLDRSEAWSWREDRLPLGSRRQRR